MSLILVYGFVMGLLFYWQGCKMSEFAMNFFLSFFFETSHSKRFYRTLDFTLYCKMIEFLLLFIPPPPPPPHPRPFCFTGKIGFIVVIFKEININTGAPDDVVVALRAGDFKASHFQIQFLRC